MRRKYSARACSGFLATLPLVWACGSSAPPVESPPPSAPPAPVSAPVVGPSSAPSANAKNANELETLGFDAYLWGFAIVENYKAIYAYNVNASGAEYKGPFNKLVSSARVYTPADKAVITPNSDTPYGFLTLDLRAEPQLLSVPAVEKDRYYSLQFVDAYTHNFAYVGTRATGNEPGRYLVTGPSFKGPKPAGVDQVFSAESELALVIYRTQLRYTQDLEQVKKVQAGYSVMPLHEFTKSPAPPAPARLEFPIWDAETVQGIGFFSLLDFLLDLMPVVAEDAAIRQRLLVLGVGAPGKWEPKALTKADRDSLLAGQQRGQKKLAALAVDSHFLGHEVTAGDLFGTRASLGGDVRRRDVGAMLGIYGNSREEALYPIYRTDSAGKELDASQASYTLRFEKGKLPPAKAFWSLTMYDGSTKLLVENPLQRYLINSNMLQTLARDADGGITLRLAQASPGKAKEANWLPAPAGPFYAVLRIYNPEPAAYDGSWKLPSLVASPKSAPP